MVEEDQQAWSRSAQGQYRSSYTEHDAAIDRAIAETYGGGSSGALRDADGNRQAAQKSSQARPPKPGSSYSYSGGKRDKPRGQSASRVASGKIKTDLPKGATETEKWIHRDKLALIEVQEYREAGLEPPQELLRRLAESRAETSRDDTDALRDITTPDPEQYDDAQEELGDEPQGYPHDRNDTTQDHDYSEEQYNPEQHRNDADTADNSVPNGQPSPRQPGSNLLRKSHSRLPVSTSSQERESVLPTKRSASNAAESESIGYPKVRARKGSVGSQAMLDDEPATPTSGGFPRQLSKQRTGSSTKPKEKGKGKFNTISGIPQTRSTSTGRPGTAGEGRPRTATNPPEGDPPWLTGMYKPDPRLPPDQQMLPTHARRLAQEQWERDGKNANTYDRDLNPLSNFDDASELQAAEKVRAQSSSPEKGQESGRINGFDAGQRAHESPVAESSPTGLGIEGHPDGNWPLTSSRTPSPSKKRINGNGYSTIPRVTDSPKPAVGLFPSPRPGDQPMENQRPVTRHGPGPQPEMSTQLGLETRVTGGLEDPEKGKEEKKRGGCGCCVVM